MALQFDNPWNLALLRQNKQFILNGCPHFKQKMNTETELRHFNVVRMLLDIATLLDMAQMDGPPPGLLLRLVEQIQKGSTVIWPR